MSAEDRVFVGDRFFETVHGEMTCVECHGGDNETDLTKEAKALAHSADKNFIAHPSQDAATYCGECHSEETENFANSLHYTQAGYFERFKVRAGGMDLRNDANMLAGFKQDCGSCHATCGQCHVTRPVSVKSGLNWGHEFKKIPDLNNNCTACHGSRVGEEYKGSHAGEAGWPAGIRADVHYNNGFRCDYCHTGHEMHGDGSQYFYRYIENSSMVPKCEDCHTYSDPETSSPDYNGYHATHWTGSGSTLQCQVCHSQSYKSCNGCHAKGTASHGGITGKSYPSFKIGKNYLPSVARDYDYALVRHIPISPDTYNNWGGSYTLTSFAAEPTWKYTTPHNIQRWTAQTDTTGGVWCGLSCHMNDDLFLHETDVDSTYLDAELQANENVFMD
ncbi:MAG: hypothetical protein ISR87_12130 [Candidatus Marinimicrobia bacterium]|nr:hypothetical protein [FCB group bacterium]MBL7026195.1 hypothetical protein [Candidatus Neomarinimicrobiota bacterium]